jgi:hypothetical protein
MKQVGLASKQLSPRLPTRRRVSGVSDGPLDSRLIPSIPLFAETRVTGGALDAPSTVRRTHLI